MTDEKRKTKVRARLDAQLDRLEDVHDLEFIEMVAAVPEQPFSEQLALEVLFELVSYMARANDLHELELETLRQAQPEAQKPT